VIYTMIGRLTVRLALKYLWREVDPKTAAIVVGGTVAGITAVGAIAVAGYLATREVPEA
jgi:heterodisulfide reductase subunit A-like polyferredoxin